VLVGCPDAIRRAVLASGSQECAPCGTFRRSIAAHLLEDGRDILTARELLGHEGVATAMIRRTSSTGVPRA